MYRHREFVVPGERMRDLGSFIHAGGLGLLR